MFIRVHLWTNLFCGRRENDRPPYHQAGRFARQLLLRSEARRKPAAGGDRCAARVHERGRHCCREGRRVAGRAAEIQRGAAGAHDGGDESTVGDHRRRRETADGEGQLLHRRTGKSERLGTVRRPGRQAEALRAVRLGESASQGADHQDALVRAALAEPVDGADGRDEHRGVRGLLLQCLHDGLPQDGQGDAASGQADDGDRQGAPEGAERHGSDLQHQGHPRDPLRRQGEHPGWRSLHRARA